EKLTMNGICPVAANPAPTPTRLLSAMPMLKKRSGNASRTVSALVELPRSPSSTTTFSFCRATSSSASPKWSRSGLPPGLSPALAPSCMEFLPCFLNLFGLCDRAPVPGEILLDKRDALALHRVSDEDRGLVLALPGDPQLLDQRRDVMPVNLVHAPAERPPLVHQRLERHLSRDGARLLVLVVVEDGVQPARLE